MKTPQLVQGDFQIGPGGFTMIEGTNKVKQDLGVMVREAFGGDRFHPRWGTVLDNFIGRPIGPETATYVRSEINRLVQNYMIIQSNQISRDKAAGRKSRYKPEEVVSGIGGIQVDQSYDRLLVRVVIETQDGQTFDIIREVSV